MWISGPHIPPGAIGVMPIQYSPGGRLMSFLLFLAESYLISDIFLRWTPSGATSW
jgi:hypothetical protein